MRNPARLDSFYEELRDIHKKYVPDWRFGQFMMNVFNEMVTNGRDPFFPEEEQMLKYIKDMFEKDEDK